jgi:ubiquinone/menaquinone biosynthesis C-methylase UbiE
MRKINHHFSRIAHKYKDLRTTDLLSLSIIKKKLKNLTKIEAADVGCGVGRYDVKLFQYLGERLSLTCIDPNESMLNELVKNLRDHNIRNFKPIKAQASALPLSNNSLDTIFTFNAMHHFNLLGFLKEASRVLRNNGYLFIYTRLRSQNKRNIWGKYFPKFHEKETRLYKMNELKGKLKEIPALILESVEYFRYRRMAKLEWLVTQAKSYHYSTFRLYDEREFEEALKKFPENIARDFKDPDKIIWDDENIMLVIRENVS